MNDKKDKKEGFLNRQLSVGTRLFRAAGITLLAFVLSYLLMQPLSFSYTSVFAPPDSDDYSIADFYAQVADRRPVRNLDKDIVLIDIGHDGREEIAGLLEKLSFFGPKAVGVDVMFENPQPGDSLLMSALGANDRTILPVELKQESSEEFTLKTVPFFYDYAISDNLHYGAANLPGQKKGATIREFRTRYGLRGGLSIESFPVAVVASFDPGLAERLIARGTDLEAIDYPSREFLSMSADEVADRGSELSGKIVLIGALSDGSDMHSTPVGSYVSGVYIHACAISTMLRENYYTQYSSVFDWTLAALLCFMVTFIGMSVNAKIKGLVNRSLQFLLVYIAVQIGYYLYVELNIIVNFASILLMVTFGLFSSDIWNGMVGLKSIVDSRRKSRNIV